MTPAVCGSSRHSGTSDAELRHLVGVAHHDSTSAPWPLIHEKTPADACYILLSGEVGVYVGREHIATLGAGRGGSVNPSSARASFVPRR